MLENVRLNEIGKVDAEELRLRFSYHAPKGESQCERYVAIRNRAHDLAVLIVSCTPPSREQALALTNLEQTVMWANASIARRES